MSLNDPQWGKRGRPGPPDLDEIWRNVNRRLNDLLGRREPEEGPGGPPRSTFPLGGAGLLIVLVLSLSFLFTGLTGLKAAENPDLTFNGDADGVRHRETNFLFIQEWPLFSKEHQISYSIPYTRFTDQEPGGPILASEGIGDIMLNYRYQLLGGKDQGKKRVGGVGRRGSAAGPILHLLQIDRQCPKYPLDRLLIVGSSGVERATRIVSVFHCAFSP